MGRRDFLGGFLGVFSSLFGHWRCKSLIKRTPTDSVNVAHVTGGGGEGKRNKSNRAKGKGIH